MKNACVVPTTILAAFVSITWAQGPLTPPGSPAPSMKTLDQVEARTPISTLPQTITSSGSYYLTRNLTDTGAGGITISTNDVSIDLNGYSLIGRAGSVDGIRVPSPVSGVRVSNGTIRNWGDDGIEVNLAANSAFWDLQLHNNGDVGMRVGQGAIVTRCSAQQNGGDGILCGDVSRVADCTAVSNGGNGISTSFRCVVSGCSVSSSGANGILLGTGSMVRDCSSDLNAVDGIGVIPINSGVSILGCNASLNTGDGIEASAICTVRGNACNLNGLGDGAGIHVIGAGNRIIENHVTGADRGLDIDGIDNLVEANVVSGAADNYAIAPEKA